MKRLCFALPLLLFACSGSRPHSAEAQSVPTSAAVIPKGATLDASGFATIASAPPVPYSDTPPPPDPNQRFNDPADMERMNPDQTASAAAMALDRRIAKADPDNYVGVRIVRDPNPRFAFQFRRDAAVLLTRYTRDPRFTAVDGGVPARELQPIFDEWWKRFEPYRLVGGGAVEQFDGVVGFDMNVDEAEYRKVAAAQGWSLPDRLKLRFRPPANPRSIDPGLARFVRLVPREDRSPAIIHTAAIFGRVILRNGCFRVLQPDTRGEPLVIFDRDAEIALDRDGYMVVRDPRAIDRVTRIGDRMVWSGPLGVDERSAGVQQLRARCGAGPIVSVGVPQSSQQFRVRAWAIDNLARRRGISRQVAWNAMRACWSREDARDRNRTSEQAAFEDCDDPVVR